MKRRKNKGAVVAIVASLSTVSLVSVGFAAWLITGGDTATAEGSIEAETVTDKRYLIRADNEGAPAATNAGISFSGKIVFGPKTDNNISNPWLSYGKVNNVDPKMENLNAEALIWVGNASSAEPDSDDNNHSLKIGQETILQLYKATTTDSTDYDACKNSAYIADLPTPTIAATSTNTASVDGVEYKQFKVSIAFNWGTYFKLSENSDPVNPYTFFNTKYSLADDDNPENDVTLAVTTEAKDVLSAIEKINGSYSVEIKTGNLID